MSDRSASAPKLRAFIDDCDAELRKLQARFDDADDDAKHRDNKAITEFREHRSVAKDKLEEVEDAADDAWDDLKDAFEAVWNGPSASVNRHRIASVDRP